MAMKSLGNRENKVKRTIMCYDFHWNIPWCVPRMAQQNTEIRTIFEFPSGTSVQLIPSFFDVFLVFVQQFPIHPLIHLCFSPPNPLLWTKVENQWKTRTCTYSRNWYIFRKNIFYWSVCKCSKALGSNRHRQGCMIDTNEKRAFISVRVTFASHS